MQKSIYTLALGVALVLKTVPVRSCTCVSQSIAAQVSNADWVFKGTVINKPFEEFYQLEPGVVYNEAVRFQVKHVYKGEIQTQSIDIGITHCSSCCEYDFKQGRTYLVFAYRRQLNAALSAPFISSHYTTMCSGTRLYSNIAGHVILHVIKPPFIWY